MRGFFGEFLPRFSGIRLDNPFQIIKGENTGGVPVFPDRLDGVIAHGDNFFQLERGGGQFRAGIFIKVSEKVRLALATGAGTMAAQFFERDEAFVAVVPFDRQFRSDLLEVNGAHQRFPSFRWKAASVSGLT